MMAPFAATGSEKHHRDVDTTCSSYVCATVLPYRLLVRFDRRTSKSRMGWLPSTSGSAQASDSRDGVFTTTATFRTGDACTTPEVAPGSTTERSADMTRPWMHVSMCLPSLSVAHSRPQKGHSAVAPPPRIRRRVARTTAPSSSASEPPSS